MLRSLIATVFAAVISCSASASAPLPSFWPAPPPTAAIDTIEQHLRAQPCVGDLSRWQRRYTYHKWVDGTVYHVDGGVIDFYLAEAGKFGFEAGRKFVDEPLLTGADDRDYKTASGSYDFVRHQFRLASCGSNVR